MPTNSKKIQLENFRINIGFDFDALTADAVAHERTDTFKRCVRNLMERSFGLNQLTQASTQRDVSIDSESGTVEDSHIVHQARRFLQECTKDLSTTRINDRVCRHIPPNCWEKVRGMPVFCGDDPMSAREAAEEYDRVCQAAGQPPLEENVRRELFALPVTLTVTWEVPLDGDPPKDGADSSGSTA